YMQNSKTSRNKLNPIKAGQLSIGLAVALLGSVGIAHGDTWTFNLPQGCTSSNAVTGATIRVTGEGAFDPDPGAEVVEGSGNYSIRNSAGKFIGHGSWSATSFIKFDSDGGPNTGLQGGTLKIWVTLHPDGGSPQDGVPLVMTIICPFV